MNIEEGDYVLVRMRGDRSDIRWVKVIDVFPKKDSERRHIQYKGRDMGIVSAIGDRSIGFSDSDVITKYNHNVDVALRFKKLLGEPLMLGCKIEEYWEEGYKMITNHPCIHNQSSEEQELTKSLFIQTFTNDYDGDDDSDSESSDEDDDADDKLTKMKLELISNAMKLHYLESKLRSRK